MDESEATNIAKSFLLLKDKNLPLYAKKSEYNFLKRMAIRVFLLFKKNSHLLYPEEYVVPTSFEIISMNRELIEGETYETSHLWIFFYSTNLAIKEKHPRFWLPIGEGTFFIYKNDKRVYETGIKMYNEESVFDFNKQFSLYEKGLLSETEKKNILEWGKGIPPRE
ncbi:hypothetical protein [Aureispira anguillae]|uniref:Uncharacterized protein n=1 Tax=Aureispira anguillae TaxID=2864201 RepID=A0A916DY49_9BACT|nr:hypothetical protein [Aureispira anguillae]BDS15671.1 hypothetical protein AsAng_0064550 [Aureispira anguillae]